MALTDTAIRKAVPHDKPYKLSDGGGMYLEVMPTGAKYWRLKYRTAERSDLHWACTFRAILGQSSH